MEHTITVKGLRINLKLTEGEFQDIFKAMGSANYGHMLYQELFKINKELENHIGREDNNG